MKTLLKFLFAIYIVMNLTACTSTADDQAKYAIQTYLKVNLKPQNSYEPISFSKIDTLSPPDTMLDNQISFYKIKHEYSIVNKEKKTIKMNVEFYLNKELKVLGTSTTSLTENE